MALVNYIKDRPVAHKSQPQYFDPFSDFNRMFDNAVRLFHSFEPDFAFGPLQRHLPISHMSVAPIRMNVQEDKKNHLVTATFELPGIDKKDVVIDLCNDILTIHADAHYEQDREDNGYHVRERRRGRFSRAVPVPEGTKQEDIRASMDNGVLTITYPGYSGRLEYRSKRIPIC